MSKLRGAAKVAFLKRMAQGRKKAAAAKNQNPKKRATTAGKRPKSRKTPREKHLAAMGKVVRTGKGHARLQKLRSRLKKRPNGRRRNEGTAEEMYEKFHQKPPGRIIQVDQVYNYPAEFAELGKLKELRFDLDNHNLNFPLTQFRGTRVVCTPDGANIYFLEGDQSIDFEAMDIATDKDMVELGPCTYICYHTQKGFHDFEPIDYFHHFGEEDGIYPVLNYDRLNKALFLVSGNYRVRPEGIVN